MRRIASVIIMAGLAVTLIGADHGRSGPPWRFEARAIDGFGNNPANPHWGATGTMLMRMTVVDYADGVSSPAGTHRPSPRMVSNLVCAQDGQIPNTHGATDFLWQWGQFIDHDITLVDVAHPLEPFYIPVPPGDPMFDPDNTGDQWITLERSAWMPGTGTGPDNPRQQMQFLTAFIDASQVYGADQARADALRANDGTGRLKTSDGDLLPWNVEGFPNLGGPSPDLFLAGDIRVNEQASLTVMHTLWMREHNHWADEIRGKHPNLGGDDIYEMARRMVGAEIQVITYEEFLPLLLGRDAIGPYAGHDPAVQPDIANVFATACYRVGHTLLSPFIRRKEADGTTSAYGDLALRDAFFAPHVLTEQGGIEPILRGLASHRAQNVDPFIIDDVRNFLFGPPGAGGFDLAALNLQRGRDHGLPSYNQVRIDMGLEPAASVSDISSSPQIQQSLLDAYGHVDEVEVWVGALAEDPVPGAMVGELIRHVVGDQFRRLRDGDRFWYENAFNGAELQRLRQTRLADVIRRNTEIGNELPDDVFHMRIECDGNVNGDAVVDTRDLLMVLSSFGTGDSGSDMTGDGFVDVADLLVVVRAFGPCDGP